MTVQVLKNFVSSKETDLIIELYSHRLSEVKERPGFYEDVYTPKDTLMPLAAEHKERLVFNNNETEDEKRSIIMMNNIIYLVKKEIEFFYKCKELSSFEGGLVKLTKGAQNGLHSDMYNLDGSLWDDGLDREDKLEYSALLYMSDQGVDFHGGTISFPRQELEIGPKKGLLVFFRGDLDHVHEISEVSEGSRYAMVMFFGH